MAISKGDGVRMEYRDAKGTLRVITGKATAVGGSTVTFKSDGGQPGFPRGKSIRVALEDVQRTSNPSPVTAQRTKGGGVKISITVPSIAAAKKVVQKLGVVRVANPKGGLKIHIRKISIDRDGYDKGGRYWDVGKPLFQYETSDTEVEGHLRAESKGDAIRQLKRKYPQYQANNGKTFPYHGRGAGR